MNITVFMSSLVGKDSVYVDKAMEFGEWIAKSGHTMVFGGSREGLMEKMATSVLEHGGKVIGIQTKLLNRRYGAVPNLTCLELPDRMSERINRMIELGDIFVIFPGAVGTLEEAATVMSMNKLGIINKMICFYNLNGFYTDFENFYNRINQEGWGDERSFKTTRFVTTLDEIKAIANSCQK